jgi:hypothetical protein
MSLPSNGITQNVIREMMPPYDLSPDLLEAIFAALPPPPPEASATWRQARITRLMQEISTLMPANAAQARLTAEILIVRELAETIAARAYAPELTVAEMCRVGRTSAELVRTAAGVERLLARQQQKPAPFFGTVLADGVDVAAVDAGWCRGMAGAGAMPQSAAELRPGGEAEDAAGERGDLTAGAAVAGMAGSTPGTSARGQGLPAMMIGTGTAMPIGTAIEKADAKLMNRENTPEASTPPALLARTAPGLPGVAVPVMRNAGDRPATEVAA